MKVTDRNGFSMVEVLVAATILIIVVMMLGALFQQSSTAWRIGLMRTGGYAQIRSYIGTLQRDASTMINANQLPRNLLCDGNKEQDFSSGEVRFYTMTGADDMRALNYITYDLTGYRRSRTLRLDQMSMTGNATWSGEIASDVLKFLPNEAGDNVLVQPQRFRFETSSLAEYDRDGNVVSGNRRFPLYLTVDAAIRQSGSMYDVGAESAGPDKVWGTKDDIRTFLERD